VKEALCDAFCREISVRRVGAGLAISTPFNGPNGEPIGFYVLPVGEESAAFRLEDDGTTIPMLEANGIDFTIETRGEAFRELLVEHGASYDPESCVLMTPSMSEDSIPAAALRFSAMLLRVQDFLLLTPERVMNTFRQDAAKAIKDSIGSRAQIYENAVVSKGLAEFPADMVIRAAHREPVAVFFGVSEQRISEAVMLQMSANYEARVPVSVVGILEHEHSLSGRNRQRAANRLAALTYFRNDEIATVQRLEREVFGVSGPFGHA